MTKLEILRGARKLVANPSTWLRGSMAVNQAGHSTDPMSPYAVRFCSVGAIWHVAGDMNEAFNITREMGKNADGLSLMSVNDRKGQIAALKMFDKEIAKEEALAEKNRKEIVFS